MGLQELLKKQNSYFSSRFGLNIFFCQFKQLGWATSSYNINYGSPPAKSEPIGTIHISGFLSGKANKG